MVRRLLGLAVLATAVGPAAADDKPAPDAKAVIKKAIDVHGGAAALDKYPASTAKMKGELTTMGIDMAFTGEVAYALPNKYRMAMDAEAMGQKFAIVQTVRGDAVKMTINGTAVPLPDDAKAEIANALVLQEVTQLTPLLDADKFTLKSAEAAEADGKKATKVVVTGKRLNDKEVKLFFAADTGLLVRMERKSLDASEGVKDEVIVLGDYKDVSGVKVPLKTVITHDGKKFMSIEMSDVALLAKLDDKAFPTDD